MNLISIDNGNSFHNISYFNDEQIHRICEDILNRDWRWFPEMCDIVDNIYEDNEKDWLIAFMDKLGQDYIIG